MRWGMRAIGLISVVILARLLDPADFGIITMAGLLLGLLESFAELGMAMIVIRERELSRTDLDTAWTLRIIQGLLLAALLAILADPVAAYFHEPRVKGVIVLSAASQVLISFENIGVALIRKELDFARDFWYQVIVRFISVAATIALAFALHNYWALALAQPVTAVTTVVLSYGFHPYRPRLNLKSWRRFLSFSANIVMTNIARFLSSRADTFIVGSIATSEKMGLYNVASELSSMPSRELTVSVGRAMFPSLAKLPANSGEFLVTFFQVIGLVSLICLPIGFGIWAVADDLVLVILGAKWTGASKLIVYLAFYGTLVSLIEILIGHILIVTGHEQRQMVAMWIRGLLLAGCGAIGILGGVEGVAIGATVSSALMFGVSIWMLRVTLNCRYAEFVSIFWRPTVAAVVMAAVVRYAVSAINLPVPARFACAVVIGVTTYFTLLTLLWVTAGKPAGAESAIIQSLGRREART